MPRSPNDAAAELKDHLHARFKVFNTSVNAFSILNYGGKTDNMILVLKAYTE